MNLKDQGWRFVRHVNGRFDWKLPVDVKQDDLDCTDMSDEEFAQAVEEAYWQEMTA